MKGLVAAIVVAVVVIILINVMSKPKSTTVEGATLDGLTAQVTQ